jgi:hypothetical protein
MVQICLNEEIDKVLGTGMQLRNDVGVKTYGTRIENLYRKLPIDFFNCAC